MSVSESTESAEREREREERSTRGRHHLIVVTVHSGPNGWRHNIHMWTRPENCLVALQTSYSGSRDSRRAWDMPISQNSPKYRQYLRTRASITRDSFGGQVGKMFLQLKWLIAEASPLPHDSSACAAKSVGTKFVHQLYELFPKL